jgi:hypothetical protein
MCELSHDYQTAPELFLQPNIRLMKKLNQKLRLVPPGKIRTAEGQIKILAEFFGSFCFFPTKFR